MRDMPYPWSFLSVSYVVKFKPRESALWIIRNADSLIPCILFSPTNAFFWVWKLHKSRCDNLSFLLMLNLTKKKKKKLSNIPDRLKKRQKAGLKTVVSCGDVASLLIYIFLFEWGTLVMRTQEDTLFFSFSVNNRLSLFIPLPSSVPPSPAFSFSPLSLWLCASQHQRESSDLWPQQPTLNLAKEGEHPVCSLAGPK